MSNLFWRTEPLMVRLQLFFPKSHVKPRGDGRRVLSGIGLVNRNGLRWCDAPKECGPPKTLYNRWKRWRDKGVFARMMDGLASEAAVPKTEMIDVSGHAPLVRACPRKYLKAHRTATSLWSKKGGAGDQKGRLDRAHEGWQEHQAACRCRRRGTSDRVFMTAGQVIDHTWAAALLGSLPQADWLRPTAAMTRTGSETR